ncbi:unnamed protein product [Rotaria socialis]|uniref:Phosphatidic acid phosphatase type 2/haloperoxidase domain-containing protein n=1 Tax=Rotaria socialis TaxID=392032 RepID=A0A818AWW1_9BILA|nr:unnamed protein product [Rotaria socialis]CAF4913917.1 unnamed protein product [Rotaria socialis]
METKFQFQQPLLIILLILIARIQCISIDTNLLRTQAKNLIEAYESKPTDAILFWNAVLLNAAANDYDNSIADSPDQAGPTTTSRAFAIIHGAMYEAMNGFERIYISMYRPSSMPATYDVPRAPAVEAAITEAAYQTLYALYPKQRELFTQTRNNFIKLVRGDSSDNAGINKGILVGKLLALTILESRSSDNSQNQGTYKLINQTGYHQPDPTHPDQPFLSPRWGTVTPFVIQSGSQFRASNTVGNTLAGRRQYLRSEKYISDYNEVVSLGTRNSQTRTADQTEVCIFLCYDGAPKLGVPPRLYNQVVRVIAIKKNNTLQQNAQLFAFVNYAMADAGISAWETKYYYELWRPILGVRQGSPTTRAIPNWLPLGAPADGGGDNFTPPFPSYVSGHSTFGSAAFEMLRLFYGTDQFQFQFQSDEYNGATKDSITGRVRPNRTRSYERFSQAEEENFLSRIYLGVHWRIDQEEGRTMGRKIAKYIYDKLT